MKWDFASIDLYLSAQEYIDTAVFAAIPLTLGDKTKETLEKINYLLTCLTRLEEELKGRVMLFPVYQRLESYDLAHEIEGLSEYVLNHQFKHVVWLSLFKKNMGQNYVSSGKLDNRIHIFEMDEAISAINASKNDDDLNQLVLNQIKTITELWTEG